MALLELLGIRRQKPASKLSPEVAALANVISLLAELDDDDVCRVCGYDDTDYCDCLEI